MPHSGLAPAHRAGIHFEILDDETVVYDSDAKRAVYLSETATVIWQLCDGKRTIGEIREILSTEYPEAASRIAQDIDEAIEQMSAERIIELKDPASDASDAPSSN